MLPFYMTKFPLRINPSKNSSSGFLLTNRIQYLTESRVRIFTCNGQFTHSQPHYNKVSFLKVLFSWGFDHFILLKSNSALPILVPLLAIRSKEVPFLLYGLVMKTKGL